MTGLVLEGGAMRGLFSAGVMDVMLEHGISYDGMIGVSAGAAFGCNYKSKQIGRVLRYNAKYCKDPRYCSVLSLLLTGNLYGAKFCYYTIPEKLDIFDKETFENNPMDFHVVTTNIETGKPVYEKFSEYNKRCVEWIRASASLPLVSKIVKIDGYKLLDGGLSDSIPVKYFQSIGYDKNVVVLTQPEGFVKEVNKQLKHIKKVYRKYPEFINTIANRHYVYNETLEYIHKQEAEGKLFVIRPPEKICVKGVGDDAETITKAYNMGRDTALKCINELKEFLGV